MNDRQRFAQTNQLWVRIMERAHRTNNFIACCAPTANIQAELEHIRSQLETCQRSLVEYLRGKRDVFPRFNFISDASLLALISDESNPKPLDTHVKAIQ